MQYSPKQAPSLPPLSHLHRLVPSHCTHQALEAACQEAVDVSIEGRVLTITTALPSGGDVGDLWAALELAGMEGSHLQWVAGEEGHCCVLYGVQVWGPRNVGVGAVWGLLRLAVAAGRVQVKTCLLQKVLLHIVATGFGLFTHHQAGCEVHCCKQVTAIRQTKRQVHVFGWGPRNVGGGARG